MGKPHVQDFIVLEFHADWRMSDNFGLDMSKAVNVWMAKGYVPLGTPLLINSTVYFSLVLKV